MAVEAALRACACGCGTPVTGRSQFAYGHFSRVGPRKDGVLQAVRQLAVCACGCGELVRTPGGKYRPGHHARVYQLPQSRRFHDELRELLAARGWSGRRASLEAKLSPTAVARCLNQQTYLVPAALERLSLVLGAAAGTAETWAAEAVAAHPWYRKGLETLSARSEPKAVYPLECGECGKPFASDTADQVYCSIRCVMAARSKIASDSALKGRFQGRLKARSISCERACAEMGVRSRAVTAWLRRKQGRLERPLLTAVASWLGVAFDDAVKLQGGTAEERRTERALNQLRRIDKKTLQRQAKNMQRVMRERRAAPGYQAPSSERLREALKAHYQRPDANRTMGQYTKTLHGRAQQILRALRYRHPELSAEDIESRAITHLMGPPYNVGSRRGARALLQPLHRSTPGSGGRPRANDRHTVVVQLLRSRHLTPYDRKPRNFWNDAETVVLTVEGPDAPIYEGLRRWWVEHLPTCHECANFETA